MSKCVNKPSSQIQVETAYSRMDGITESDLFSLLHFTLTTTFIQNIDLLFDSPIENIISIRRYPFNVSRTAWNIFDPDVNMPTENIYINTVNSNITGYILPPAVSPLIDVGGAMISKHFNSFLDYAPYTSIELFLPFYGFVTLETDLVIGKYLSVKYGVDYNTGMCTAFVEISSSSAMSDRTLIMTVNFKIGIDFPICGGGFNEIAKSLTKTVVNFGTSAVGTVVGAFAGGGGGAVAGNVASKIAVGAITNTGSTVNDIINQRLSAVKGEVTAGFNNYFTPTNMYLIITRPNVYYPTNYDHTNGRPLEYTTTLDTLYGYTEVGAIHLEDPLFGSALTEEKDEIERLLKSGVLLANYNSKGVNEVDDGQNNDFIKEKQDENDKKRDN